MEKNSSIHQESIFTRVVGRYDKAIFWPVLSVFLIVITLALVYPQKTANTLVTVRNYFIFNYSWAFMLGVGIISFFCFFLALSSYGDLKLGKDNDKPEFSFFTWIAMLFSCGFGIGFVFYSVSEPLTHLHQSPYVQDAETVGTLAGIPDAVQATIFDWGIHGWCLFAISAWAIAFPAYRLGKPLTMATGLYPFLGDRCNTSLLGKLADGLGVFGTIGGNAAMIGLGVASISYGIENLFGLVLNDYAKIGVMMVLIVAYIISAATGVHRGIKYLSNFNVALAGIIVLILLFFGKTPTQYLLNLTVQMFGSYFNDVWQTSFWLDSGNAQPRNWLGWWPVFYWLWYVSYIPFCGGFIARISKGRTLREFMLGVIFVPTLLAILWFSIWGGSACYTQTTGIAPLWDQVQANQESGIYALLNTLDFGWILSFMVLINVIIFAITTSDSASFFVAMQMSYGSPDPKISMRLLWGVIIGATGIIFQFAGGFYAIKSLAIVVGAPFFFVAIFFMFSVVIMLKRAKKGLM